MPFDHAEIAVEDMLHIGAQCAAVDLKMLPINEKPFPQNSAAAGIHEVTVNLGTIRAGPQAKPKNQNNRVIAVDFVRMPSHALGQFDRVLAPVHRMRSFAKL